MTRRLAGALCALVSAVTLLATAAPASAAPLQDFYLVGGNTGFAFAQGVVVNGAGTYTRSGPNRETILLPAGPVELTRTPVTSTDFSLGACRSIVRETGTFDFSHTGADGTQFGGEGSYTLTGFRTGQRAPSGGCTFPPSGLSAYSVVARSTSLFALPPPPPPAAPAPAPAARPRRRPRQLRDW